jgi:PAS domain S-box-containing protein
MSKTTRILVVDDEPAILTIFSQVLKSAGYEVLNALTGEQGLQVAREKRPDVVLLDVKLPDLSGVDVCRQIKADPDLKDVFVVLCSGGATSVADKVGGLETGADDYLAKPLSPAELLARIRNLVRLRDAIAALRASEQHYRRLIEILPDAVGLIDVHGRLTAVNPQALAMLGYTDPPELLKKSAFDLTPPEEHERMKTAMANALETGVVRNLEYKMLKKNGDRLPVELSVAALKDAAGQPLELVTVVRDITERKQAEKKIHQLLDLLDHAHDAIIIRTLEGDIQYFNKGAERLLGWTAEEVYGRRVTDLFFKDNRTFMAAQQELRRTGEWNGEVHALTKPGQLVILHKRCALVHSHEDQSPYVVSINTNITERKLAEELLREREELSQRIINTAEEGFWMLDLKGNLVNVNDAYCRMSGYSREELLAMHIGDVEVKETSPEVVAQHIKLVIESGSDRFETQHRRKDGRIIEVEVIATFLAQRERRIFAFLRDITERKQAENALRASEERFRQLAENIREVFWMTDLTKNEMIYISPRYEEIWGQTCESLYASPRKWLESIHPDDRERALEAALTKQVSGQYDEVYRIVRSDCSIRWIHDRAFPIRDDTGKVYRVVGIAEDITKRKQAEEALRESEARKSAIMRAALDAIITVDQDGRIRDLNPAAEHTFGCMRAKMLGKEMAAVMLPPSLRDWFRRGLTESFTGPEGAPLGNRMEVAALRADGTEFPVEFIVTRIELDGPPLFTAFIRDISESKRAQEQIRLFADAIQSTQELICITDPENRFTFFNQAFREAYGYSREEMIGRTPEFLYSPSNPPGLCEQVFQETLAGGWKGELLNRRKDGTDFPVSLSTSQIKNSEGKTLGLIGMARDITARNRAEKQNTALSLLGHRLSAATTPEQAANIILGIASELFGWDAGFVNLYSQTENKVIPILMVDTVDGQRQPCKPDRFTRKPTPLMQLIMKEGARLINRGKDSVDTVEFVRFGNPQRHSACMMFVPIHSSGAVVGILSIQSYTLRAYTEDDLQLLQTLADHCGDALLRIEVAEALRVAETKYRRIFEDATEGIFQMTPDGRYRSANPALARMLGYETSEELISAVTNIARQTYVVPEKLQELKRLLETQGSVLGFEAERYRKDGKKIWMSLNAHVVRDADGAILHYEGTNQDITERKQAEAVLRESEERFRALFESAPIGIALHDADGHYIHTNRAYQEMLGYSDEELKRLGVKRITRSDDVVEGQHLFGELRDGTRNFYRREKRYLNKNGRQVWAESSASAVRDHQGKLCYIISMVEDISARKQAEEELRLLPQRIIEAQESERQRVARELHDGVNQIIASAKMRLVKVQENLAALSPAAREILSRCGQLLNQALEENRRIAHNLRPSDLDELGLAASCRNLCKEMESRASLTVKSTIKGLDERLPSHMELNLFRILQEALTNVEKHAGAKKVHVQIACRKDLIVLTIQDDGRGFAVQSRNGGKKKRRGIGLTNMRERAAFLGGTCETESAPKQGTVITVRIPRTDAK